MKKYSDMSKEELLTLKAQLDKEYADIKAKGLALDMSRGKPSADQLDLSMGLMNVLSSDSDLKCETGVVTTVLSTESRKLNASLEKCPR